MPTKLVKTGLIEANGTHLYHELRGDGPPVVFISGATGDAGHFEPVAEQLADAYTVLTYDRRGNGRSPRPDGWTTTSVEEQTDDLVALIEALGLERPIAIGNSAGANILVGALHHQPDAFSGAIVHEPGLTIPIPGAESEIEELMERMAAAAGDPDAMMEAAFHWLGIDIAVFPVDVLARMTASHAEVTMPIEFPGFASFVPDEDVLGALHLPIRVAYGQDTTSALFRGSAEWVARATGGDPDVFPGGHVGFLTHAARFAEVLRPILASMS